MSDILNQKIVLRLNANFLRLGWSTVAEAMIAMSGEAKDGSPPAKALDVVYDYDEFGKPYTDKYQAINEFDWEEWIKLEPRKGDLDKVIHTSKRIIRVPTVIVCPRYYKMPEKELRATPKSIYARYGNRCQYTNVLLTNQTRSLDHVNPKSKGGKDTWENLVPAHKDVNHKKGNKTNKEAGLVLLRKPTAPPKRPLCTYIVENKHPDHLFF